MRFEAGDQSGGEAARQRAVASSRRHTRRVRLLKFAVPVVGLVILAAVVGKTMLAQWLLPGVSITSALLTTEGLTMIEPKLAGRANKRAYAMTGERAIQSLDNPNRIRIEAINGMIEMDGGGQARVEAKLGLYDRSKETFRVERDVRIDTTRGEHVRLDAADIDMKTGRLVSDGPVEIKTPQGELRAARAEVSDNGRVLLFTGGVTMVVKPPPPKEEEAPATDKPPKEKKTPAEPGPTASTDLRGAAQR